MTDQLVDTAYVVQTGLVKVVVEQADGSELILAILGPSDVIGALTIGETPDEHEFDLLPLGDTNLFWIDRPRCLRGACRRCRSSAPTSRAYSRDEFGWPTTESERWRVWTCGPA